MLIKFKPDSTNGGYKGLFDGIAAAVTAAAGSTPAAPSYVSSWTVIDNTVAGGWSVNENSLGTSSAGYLKIYNNVANTSIAKTKGLELYYTGASPNYSYQPRPRMYVGNSAGNPIAYQYLDPGNTSATSTAYYDNWNKKRYPYSYEFVVAATSEYVYIWWVDESQNSTSASEYTLLGVADHNFANFVEEGNTTQHCPFYGICITQNHYETTTSNQPNYNNMHIAWLHHLDTDGYFNAIQSGNRQYAADHIDTSLVGQNYIRPMYPQFANINLSTGTYSTGHYYVNMFNESGKAVPTIHEIILGSPQHGNPYKLLKGLYWVGTTRYLPTSEWNNKCNILEYTDTDIVTDETPSKTYRAYPAGNHLFAVLKQ